MSYTNIKTAALKLFSQKGFYGTTIKEIASECGLKPSSIYSHITSKEELFIDIFYECIQNISKSIADLHIKVEQNILINPKKILYLYYVAIIKHFLLNTDEYLYLKQATFFIKNSTEKQPFNAYELLVNDDTTKYFKRFFIELQKENLIINEDYLDLFHSYLGVIIAYLEEQLIYNFKLTDTHIDKFWNIFWDGILK